MMACFDHLSPSSVLSPLLGMDVDCETNVREAGLSSLEVDWPEFSDIGPAAVTSTSPPAPTSSSSSSKRALSSTSSLLTVRNGGVTKVSSKPRRKSRAKPKAPVSQLSATKLNFKDIVHQYTGAPPSKAPSSQSSPTCPVQMPGITENQGASDGLQHLLSELTNASIPEKDALLAGVLLAQSLKTLDCISSYILQSNMSPDTTNTQKAEKRNLLSSCGSEQIDTACRERSSVAELEDYLLKGGDSAKRDPYFSLSCVLLNQISSQCRVLSSRS